MGKTISKIAFLGLGVMGKPIAGHLLKAGYRLTVYSRTRSKARDLLKAGALWASSPAEAAESVDCVISMVGTPQDVQAIYLGRNGVFQTLSVGKIIVDMTTSSPSLAEKLEKYGIQRKIFVLDAPVSGGDVGAIEGTLTTMVGGRRQAFNKLLPIFKTFCKNILYQGKAGSGQHTKLVNQIVITGTMIGMVEGLFYAKNAGLNLHQCLSTIQKGAAGSWTLDRLAPRILKKDYNPGFMIEHFIKDMGLALLECHRMKISLPGLEKTRKLYKTLLKQGYGRKGTQALIHSLDPYF